MKRSKLCWNSFGVFFKHIYWIWSYWTDPWKIIQEPKISRYLISISLNLLGVSWSIFFNLCSVMFRPSALLWSLLTALPNLCSSQRIKGGSTVERDSRLNFPYQVSIGRGGQVPDIICGGSLISLRSLQLRRGNMFDVLTRTDFVQRPAALTLTLKIKKINQK